MKQKKVVFRDQEITEFCTVTKDTNQIHDPEMMTGIGKHVIVPGMFALCCTINLSANFLKTRGNTIRVLFNSLLSSGDQVTLCSIPNPDIPDEIRLSAISHKDTLTSKNDYTRIIFQEQIQESGHEGILRRLEFEPCQVDIFASLIEATENDTASFLFSVAYASQALLKSIRHPITEIETEIDELINRGNGVSPFYHALEIRIPGAFPDFKAKGFLDYFIHFEREKKNRSYVAHLRCEHAGKVIFHARYNLMGIADQIILRMAKEIALQNNTIGQ